MADKDPLGDFFEAARANPPKASEALLARIAADAEAERLARAAASRPQRGGWRGVLQAIGGWPGAVGLATAAAAGVWIGLAQPLGVDPLAAVGLGDQTAALSTGYADLSWGEG